MGGKICLFVCLFVLKKNFTLQNGKSPPLNALFAGLPFVRVTGRGGGWTAFANHILTTIWHFAAHHLFVNIQKYANIPVAGLPGNFERRTAILQKKGKFSFRVTKIWSLEIFLLPHPVLKNHILGESASALRYHCVHVQQRTSELCCHLHPVY